MSNQYPSRHPSPRGRGRRGRRGNRNTPPKMQQQLNQMGVPNATGTMGFDQSNAIPNPQLIQASGSRVGSGTGMGQHIQQRQMAGQHQLNPNQAIGQAQQQPSQRPQQQQQQSGQQSPHPVAAGHSAASGFVGTASPGPLNARSTSQTFSNQHPVPAGHSSACGFEGAASPGQPNADPNAQILSNVQQTEYNPMIVCRMGQEAVQHMTSRFREITQLLRGIQPPNGTDQGQLSSNDKKEKLEEMVRKMKLQFQFLRILYDKCNESCQQGMEFVHVEGLIPLKGEPERAEPIHTEQYTNAMQDKMKLIEIAKLQNAQLLEIIDKMRLTIWEINTMMSMRRS